VFVYVTSRAEAIASVVHEGLEGVTVADVMIHPPIVVPGFASLREFRGLLTTTSQRQFPVVDAGGRYVGMVDVRTMTSLDSDAHLRDVADPRPPFAPDQLVVETGLLEGTRGEAVAVVDQGHVVGLVRTDDVVLLADQAISRSHS
jgi:CBS domain-containing protein